MAKRITVTLSDDLAEAAEILRKRKGRLYRSLPEYIQAIIRFDCQTQRDHVLTQEYAALSPYERDRLDKGLLEQVKKGEGVRGSWLFATIHQIVKEAPHLSEQGVAERLARECVEKVYKESTFKPKNDKPPSR